ncbi:MAG: acyltransferase, partial [Methanobacteriota archaeon]
MLRIGYYQFRPHFGKVQKNLQQVISALQTAEADIIVLPELAFTGYYFQDREEVKHLAEDPYHSSTVETLQALCREKRMHLVTGFAEKAGDKFFNSALLVGPRGIIRVYRKLHLFNEEKHWFDPGDTPLEVDTILDARVGMMICFDWIFPEVTRSLAVLGADIICHPSNLVLSYCQQTMLSRCLENHI